MYCIFIHLLIYLSFLGRTRLGARRCREKARMGEGGRPRFTEGRRMHGLRKKKTDQARLPGGKDPPVYSIV